jgi:MoxR-like ATPase
VPPADPQAALRRLGPGDVTPQLGEEEIDIINAALLLRRPLLITGPPGVGKSTLAYLISRELGLGRVLEWNIVSRTTLRDGIYAHDAMGRAQAIAAWRADGPDPAEDAVPAGDVNTALPQKPRQLPSVLGDFITLGPLGTALLPYDRPRVLLVDELDKSDIDLPNDLLHVLENGSYDVPELVRDAADTARVHTSDPGGRAEVCDGRVECRGRSGPQGRTGRCSKGVRGLGRTSARSEMIGWRDRTVFDPGRNGHDGHGHGHGASCAAV